MPDIEFDRPQRGHFDRTRERLQLVGLCAVVAGAGALLAVTAGGPRVFPDVPRLQDVVETLSGSMLPVAELQLVLVDVAWLVWLWIVASLGLELFIAAVEMAAAGAQWVHQLRTFSNRVSVPLARRAVAAAFAVQVLSRAVPIAAAQTITLSDSTVVAGVQQPRPQNATSGFSEDDAISSPTYLVGSGDTLWSIAERAYGSGTEYRRVIDANLGRRMADGQLFSARGVIQPGWQLLVPGAALEVEDTDGGRWYTVQPGDTLSAIAADVLGERSRWSELFDLNRGTITADGGHTLVDPDVIWPGLRLRLPSAPAQADDPAEADHTPKPLGVDLVMASAPVAAPDAADAPSAAETPAVDAPPVDAAPPPLLRAVHTLEPIVLEPADAPAQQPQSDSEPAVAAAAVAGDAEGSLPPPVRPEVPLVPLAVGGLGVAAVAGLVFGARRRRRLRPLPQEPESDVVVDGGFAEAQLAQDLTRGLHGVGFDPLATLIARLEQFLLEYNLAKVGVLAVRHGRSSTTITLACGLAEQALLIDLAPVFAQRFDAEVEAVVTPDQDVCLRLTRLRRTRLLPPAESVDRGPCLIPLGVLYDRQMYAAAWNSLGHVLVVSLPGHGAETILTSLVATLTARRSPEQLRVWLIGSERALPAPILDLPHLVRVVDPADGPALDRAAEDLRLELDRRARDPRDGDLVVVIPELTAVGEHAAALALLAPHAAELGVRILAASSDPEPLIGKPLTAQFSTRMVLRMQSEETSVALLGSGDAATIGGGGRLLLRLEGRETVELYGYHVAPEHLERLVRVMRSGYPSTSQPGRTPAAAFDQHHRRLADEPPEAPTEQTISDSADTHATDAASESASISNEDAVSESPPEQASTLAPPRALVVVTCFGEPEVRCNGQQVWPKLAGGDVKPWEFLLYLAAQPREGVAREDAVEALWPDDDEPDNAAHRFRQLRYRLRRAFNVVTGAPDTDGICLDRGTLRLDPAVVYSDAQEFLEIVRAVRTNAGSDAIARLERARALYTADLLDGPHARRYAWVDERDHSGVTLREHFRRQFQQACSQLAGLYTAAGELESAIDVYRELTESDPMDEQVWIALFRLHARRGDRLALLREERRMRACLRDLAEDSETVDDELLLGPSQELTQEFQHLLRGLQDRDREPLTA